MTKAISRAARTCAIAAATLACQPAQATGVAAGTVIENTATATYRNGADTVSIQSNRVSLRVGELLNVVVASLTSAPVPISAGTGLLSFAVTNTGNGTESFRLAIDAALAGNPFIGTVQALAVDGNGNGTYEPGTDPLIAAGASTPALAADATLRAFVLVSLPTNAADGQTSQLRLSAAAETGTGAPGTAFDGRGDDGTDAIVGATTAQSAALGAIIAKLGSVTLTKSAVVADPFGGSRPVPGALVTYSLVTHVTGSGVAEGVTVSDGIPAGTTYEPDTLKLDGVPLTDVADSDNGTAAATGIAVTLGSLAGGSTDRTIAFTVKIN